MICLSSLLFDIPKYSQAASSLLAAFRARGESVTLLSGTRDIWVRDFMPVKTHDGRYIAFRYAPAYLRGHEDITTDMREILNEFPLPVTFSDIVLDGGNVVFSPSRRHIIVSDRIFSENPDRPHIKEELERLLDARITVIPSLKSDMTGHADGMVRFVGETAVIGNTTPFKNGHEQKIRYRLQQNGLTVSDFPYRLAAGISAVGSYLNFLETERSVFLPQFGISEDKDALHAAETFFDKPIYGINIRAIAEEGGSIHCITWEK